jgi:hypothetical protein
MAGFGISCIILVLLALAQGRPLTEVIGLLLKEFGG